MEIVNFFERLAGKWFSQRTTHYLARQESRAGQSTLKIDFLGPDSSEVKQLANDHSPLCGLRIEQDSRMSGDTQNVKSSSLMVVLADNDAERGALRISQGSGAVLTGEFALENEVLIIRTPSANGDAEERLWFVTPNLRMRTSVVKVDDEVQLTSFCSEIRMGVARPAK